GFPGRDGDGQQIHALVVPQGGSLRDAPGRPGEPGQPAAPPGRRAGPERGRVMCSRMVVPVSSDRISTWSQTWWTIHRPDSRCAVLPSRAISSHDTPPRETGPRDVPGVTKCRIRRTSGAAFTCIRRGRGRRTNVPPLQLFGKAGAARHSEVEMRVGGVILL